MSPVGPELPIACSLDAAGMAERGGEFRARAQAALVDRRQDGDRIELRFRADPGVEGAVRDLAERERQCCPFFDIRVSAGEEVVLTIAAPAEARSLLDSLFAATG